MWILGANESSKSADEEHTEQKPGQQTTSPMDSYNSIGGTNRFTRPRGMRELTKTKPYLIGSDLSEMAEYLENDEASFSDFHRTTSVGSNKTYVHIPTGKKKMSWSDELGRDLVHFIDEVSSSFRVGERDSALAPHAPIVWPKSDAFAIGCTRSLLLCCCVVAGMMVNAMIFTETFITCLCRMRTLFAEKLIGSTQNGTRHLRRIQRLDTLTH